MFMILFISVISDHRLYVRARAAFNTILHTSILGVLSPPYSKEFLRVATTEIKKIRHFTDHPVLSTPFPPPSLTLAYSGPHAALSRCNVGRLRKAPLPFWLHVASAEIMRSRELTSACTHTHTYSTYTSCRVTRRTHTSRLDTHTATWVPRVGVCSQISAPGGCGDDCLSAFP